LFSIIDLGALYLQIRYKGRRQVFDEEARQSFAGDFIDRTCGQSVAMGIDQMPVDPGVCLGRELIYDQLPGSQTPSGSASFNACDGRV